MLEIINKTKGKLKIAKDIWLNYFSSKELNYVVENKDWSIKSDGKNITESLNKLKLMSSRITTTPIGLKNTIIHFGSINVFLRKNGFYNKHKQSGTVLTWFHFVKGDLRYKLIEERLKYIDIIHTSSLHTKMELMEFGVPPEKIKVIPLGVDVELFKTIDLEQKIELREKTGIPKNSIVIGSFQKDGNGWGSGLTPKLIKGPDIFVEVVKKLYKKYPIYVILVGPSRGYVEKSLRSAGVPYLSMGYFKDYREVAKYYNLLDLYLITSRVEGGPKQILEAWASGVPVVSTRVGMVPDISKDMSNILLADIEDINGIYKQAEKIIINDNLRKRIVEKALKEVEQFSWGNIAKCYYKEIYADFLNKGR